MNSRERFLEIMHNGSPDRVPLFEEGIRAEVRRPGASRGWLRVPGWRRYSLTMSTSS